MQQKCVSVDALTSLQLSSFYVVGHFPRTIEMTESEARHLIQSCPTSAALADIHCGSCWESFKTTLWQQSLCLQWLSPKQGKEEALLVQHSR